MRRLLLVVGAIAVFGAGLGAAAFATHTSETETHTVPFTIGALTGVYTFTDEDVLPHETVVVTETVTVPTPPPPPPPPPPPSGACSVADTSGCVAATTINVSNTFWRCQQPLANYGPLPVMVRATFTTVVVPATGGGIIQLGNGCTGDTDQNTIDLILDVQGDGRTIGGGDDAVRTMNVSPGPTNIQITGRADCGPRQGDAHQDGVQALSGRNITFVDFHIGNYAAGLSTCQGAGGAFFYSGAGANHPENLDVVRGSYIACNGALYVNADGGTGDVDGARFRSRRNDGSDPVCNYNSKPPCSLVAPTVRVAPNVICEAWNGTTWMPQGG